MCAVLGYFNPKEQPIKLSEVINPDADCDNCIHQETCKYYWDDEVTQGEECVFMDNKNISNGWDVVKDSYKKLLSEYVNQQFDKSWSGFQVWITHELKWLKQELEKAGIEVE